MEDAITVYNDSILKVIECNNEDVLNFKAWFRKIVVNKAIDYNKKYFSKDFEDIVELGNHLEYEPTIQEEMEVEHLISLIQTLPPSYRTVFLLHVVEGYKFHEIATLLTITEGGAKTLYLKAKKKLQLLLTTQYQEYGYRKV